MKKGGRLSRLLGTPARALSRACDLYVSGMSRCAGRAPMGAAAFGRKFGGAADMRSATFGSGPRRWAGLGGDDDVDEHIHAASRLRVAAGSEAAAGRPGAQSCKKVAAGRIDKDADESIRAASRRRVAAGLDFPASRPAAPSCKKVAAGRIDEDAVCEFADDVPVGPTVAPAPAPGRRGVAVGGLAARPGGFGAMKSGTRVFAE